MWHDLHNYWGFWMGLDRHLGAYDDLAARGGPVMTIPGASRAAMDMWTDDRKPISGWGGWNVSWTEGGDNVGTWTGDEDDLFVFGELDSRVFEIGVRGTWVFSPYLSAQLFMQPFVSTGDYGLIKTLARPRSYEFVPYEGLGDNPDFRQRSLRSNLVLRWEYRPGSTLSEPVVRAVILA